MRRVEQGQNAIPPPHKHIDAGTQALEWGEAGLPPVCKQIGKHADAVGQTPESVVVSQPYAEIDGGGNILGLAFQNGGGAFDDGIPVDGGSALQGAELACLFQQAFIVRALTGFCACGSSVADGESSQFSKLHTESDKFLRKIFSGASAPVRGRDGCFSGVAGEGGDCCRWRLRQLSRNVCHCGMLCSDRLLPVLVSEWRRVWFVTFL